MRIVLHLDTHPRGLSSDPSLGAGGGAPGGPWCARSRPCPHRGRGTAPPPRRARLGARRHSAGCKQRPDPGGPKPQPISAPHLHVPHSILWRASRYVFVCWWPSRSSSATCTAGLCMLPHSASRTAVEALLEDLGVGVVFARRLRCSLHGWRRPLYVS